VTAQIQKVSGQFEVSNLRRKRFRTANKSVGFVKDWETIANRLMKAGWSWGCVSAIVRAEEKLNAFRSMWAHG
jgi:hypothetical protein